MYINNLNNKKILHELYEIQTRVTNILIVISFSILVELKMSLYTQTVHVFMLLFFNLKNVHMELYIVA